MHQFEVDYKLLYGYMDEFDPDNITLNERDLVMAINRALRRLAAYIRRRSSAGLKTELDLRNTKALRRRLKDKYIPEHKGAGHVQAWYGKNDLGLSAFKGRPKKTAKGVSLNGREYEGAFFGKVKGKRLVLQRVGDKAFPVVEVQAPVADKMGGYIEREILPDLVNEFNRLVKADLRARALFGVGGARGANGRV